MHEDRKIGTKEYRVILDPISTRNPEGSTVAVFVRHQKRLVRIGNEVVAMPNQSDEELLKKAWQTSEQHASTLGKQGVINPEETADKGVYAL